MGIRTQLDAGIRFFDIRLRLDAGVFRLYHGSADQRLEFEGGVLDPMLAFLARHPGETVILSIKKEDDGDDGRFARDFGSLVRRHARSFYTASDFPRLADGRGKIVVFRRFAYSALGIPADPRRWQNDATFEISTPGGILTVEDQWECPGPLPRHTDAKWSAVAGNLDAAVGSPTGWFVTFTSAASDFSFPRAIAGGIPLIHGMNQRLLDYLAGCVGHRRLGTVVMDFPELPNGRLIQRLVDANR